MCIEHKVSARPVGLGLCRDACQDLIPSYEREEGRTMSSIAAQTGVSGASCNYEVGLLSCGVMEQRSLSICVYVCVSPFSLSSLSHSASSLKQRKLKKSLPDADFESRCRSHLEPAPMLGQEGRAWGLGPTAGLGCVLFLPYLACSEGCPSHAEYE